MDVCIKREHSQQQLAVTLVIFCPYLLGVWTEVGQFLHIAPLNYDLAVMGGFKFLVIQN